MTALCEFIKTELNMPLIEEDDAVLNGCFACTPFLTGALRGNGSAAAVTQHYTIEIFMMGRENIVQSTTNLYKKLLKAGYACEDPAYVYDRTSRYWGASFNVTTFGG